MKVVKRKILKTNDKNRNSYNSNLKKNKHE